LQGAITAEAQRVADLEDPMAVIAAVGDVFACLDDALAELALPRLQAIADLRRQGWSYDRIATETNLSKGRVAQLAREARARRL
jgi:DNA-directed RNA polymerase specialized sigma24 family protein